MPNEKLPQLKEQPENSQEQFFLKMAKSFHVDTAVESLEALQENDKNTLASLKELAQNQSKKDRLKLEISLSKNSKTKKLDQ